jgi:hypothetical protein
MTSTPARLPEVISAIIDQLGGQQIFAMAFAWATHDDRSITLRIARGLKAKDGINALIIRLEPSDTYRVEFWRLSKMAASTRPIDQLDGVYGDQLRELIEQRTGLYLALGAVRPFR